MSIRKDNHAAATEKARDLDTSRLVALVQHEVLKRCTVMEHARLEVALARLEVLDEVVGSWCEMDTHGFWQTYPMPSDWRHSHGPRRTEWTEATVKVLNARHEAIQSSKGTEQQP